MGDLTKRIICFSTFLLAVVSLAYGQVPEKFSYQAVIRDASGNLLRNSEIGIKITIRQGIPSGTEVYSQVYSPSTNTNGLVTMEIGGDQDFQMINWSNGPYFMETATDLAGGNNYSLQGCSELLTVPYALHAKTADNLTSPVTENDPHFSGSPAGGIAGTDISEWNEAYDWGNHSEEGYLKNESQTLSDVASLGNHVNNQLKSVVDPTDPQDAVNKAYVDQLAVQLDNLKTQLQELQQLHGISTVEDIEGNVYKTKTYGTQTWMVENLKATKYNDGTPIPQETNNENWVQLTTDAYCNYNNDPNQLRYRGALYNGYVMDTFVNGKKNPCPEGWHVPDRNEWNTLLDYLVAGGYNYNGSTQGNLLAKAMGAANSWKSCTDEGAVGNTDYPEKRNASGFNVISASSRLHHSGQFYISGSTAEIWANTRASGGALVFNMTYNNPGAHVGMRNLNEGVSIRCLKD